MFVEIIMPKPTIHDVAREAGVAIGTVSRVLNDSPNVRPNTRLRVMQAMERLQYKPDSAARKLSRQTKLQNIGVLTTSFRSFHSFAERLRGVQAVLSEAEHNYELILYNVSSRQNFQEQLQSIVQHGDIEALLIVDFGVSPTQRQALKKVGIPFIAINHELEATYPRVGGDNLAGSLLAVRHLLELGHRHIAYVGDFFEDPRYGFSTSQERFEGFAQAHQEFGVVFNEDYIRLAEHGYKPAVELCRQLLVLPSLPTAIFAMSDTQALACIQTITDAGLRVPEDISVIGYDDLELSHYAGLTTIRQHLELSGSLSVKYLLDQLNNQNPAVPDFPLPEIIVRHSTRVVMS